MAKKTKKQAQQTKKLLIKAAIDVFYKKGFSNTTLEDIALKADLTRGALYWHFKGKAEIFICIYDGFIKELDKLFSKTIDKENATLHCVADYMKEAINMLKTDHNFRTTLELLLFKTELTGELEAIKTRDNQWTTALIEKISNIVKNHIAANNLNINMESHEMALSIEAMSRGLGMMYTINENVIPHDDSHIRIIDAFFQNILNARPKTEN